MRALDPRLLRRARPARRYVAGLVGVGVASALLVITQAGLLASGIATRSAAVLAPLALVVAARALLAWASAGFAERSAAAVTSTLRRAVVAHALRLGPRWLAGERSGEITALATSGIDGIEAYVSSYLPQLVLTLVVPLLVLAALLRADPIAAVTVLATLPLVPVFMALVGATAQARARRRLATLGRLAHHFLDVVSGLATLKAFGRAAAQERRVTEVGEAYRRETMGTLRLAFMSSLVLDLLATIAVALVAVGVGLRLAGGGLSLRTALFVLILTPEAYAPLRALGAAFHASADGVAALESVERLLSTPPPVAGGAAAMAAAGEPLTLVVDGVSVSHPGRVGSAPYDVSLRVEPGEFVALVGANGAGKSTLLGVLLGHVAPTAGSVWLETAAGRRVEASAGCFAWAPQSPYLFAGTVAENIALGRAAGPHAVSRTADSGALATAARTAALDVPLSTLVADGGVGLSAGQRRRVAVARAVLRDAPILLLDEPTAGLDDETERRMLDGLRGSGRTVIAVAHRPATAGVADRTIEVTAGHHTADHDVAAGRDALGRVVRDRDAAGSDVAGRDNVIDGDRAGSDGGIGRDDTTTDRDAVVSA